MRILFLPKLLPRADIIGGPILIYHRIKNLSLMGHRITLIAPSYTEADRKDESLKPFCERIIRVDSTRNRSHEEIEALYARLNRPRFFLTGDGGFSHEIDEAFRTILEKEHFDAIIAEYSIMGQYIESNQHLIPDDTMKVISVHECYTKAFELRREKGEEIDEETIEELSEYEFRMYSAADRILCLTPEDAEIITGYSPGLRDKIRIVPHGVDTSFYTPPREDRLKRGTKKILYIGNFEHYPNVDAVLNFMEHCWDTIVDAVPDARFYAVGFNPPEELLRLRSENVVVREGGDNESIRQTYWDSDIFVAPIALGTGFRGKLLEAMACGLPVVATRLAVFGINPRHGRDMFVTDDYGEFARYVIMLLEDLKLRSLMGENALRLARRFDHRHAAEKLERVLKEKTMEG